ncbi:uncharacterized protein LOC106877661 [Octopus bimaculoides]|uniref:uncharacterized protein LOC106877661 n=1 Tax=Octopus bimaculoides TaxID=37653 RepID=UPI00071C928F|nr:uncharacterized protein LOC106877661 [Octopus bimaculoides]|eukprot:XP_014782092.1 PREDICTED: uncharacterized protein LOC106877661 [Octopus bimaculoides]
MPPKKSAERSWKTSTAKCKVTARLRESDEERNQKLAKNQARIETARQMESLEYRAEKFAKDRTMHEVGRIPPPSFCFSEPRAAFYYDRSKNYLNDSVVLIRDLSVSCTHYGARKFPAEIFGTCCSNGKGTLPLLQPPPQPLRDLLEGNVPDSRGFLDKIRLYNSAFQMTSFGASKEVVEPEFMPTFKVQGQVYHLIGFLMPQSNEPAKFLQIYFMGDSQQQCDRRCQNFQNLD